MGTTRQLSAEGPQMAPFAEESPVASTPPQTTIPAEVHKKALWEWRAPSGDAAIAFQVPLAGLAPGLNSYPFANGPAFEGLPAPDEHPIPGPNRRVLVARRPGKAGSDCHVPLAGL